ncbi:MAG: glycerophosphodiester phosphodiesterase [Actinomycetales bacterium]
MTDSAPGGGDATRSVGIGPAGIGPAGAEVSESAPGGAGSTPSAGLSPGGVPAADEQEGPAIEVIAHRGASAELPEHSIEAYIEAIEVGADLLECDVRLTADGHLVCVHDPTTDRITGRRGRVSAMTLAQLRELDWGCATGGPLTLHDLCALVRDCGRPVGLAVETKHPTRFGGATEQAVCDLLDHFGWLPLGEPGAVGDGAQDGIEDAAAAPVRVMSFSAQALHRVRSRAPRLPRVLLLDKPAPVATRHTLPARAGSCGVDVELVRTQPAWVRAIVAAGPRVDVWTVDDEADMDACLDLGAVGIITNRPRAALVHFGRRMPDVGEPFGA